MQKFIDFITSSFVSMPNKSGKGNLLRTRSIPLSNEGYYYLLCFTLLAMKSILVVNGRKSCQVMFLSDLVE